MEIASKAGIVARTKAKVAGGVSRIKSLNPRERFKPEVLLNSKKAAQEKARVQVDKAKALVGRVFRKHDVRAADGGAAIQTTPQPEALMKDLAATADTPAFPANEVSQQDAIKAHAQELETQALARPAMPDADRMVTQAIDAVNSEKGWTTSSTEATVAAASTAAPVAESQPQSATQAPRVEVATSTASSSENNAEKKPTPAEELAKWRNLAVEAAKTRGEEKPEEVGIADANAAFVDVYENRADGQKTLEELSATDPQIAQLVSERNAWRDKYLATYMQSFMRGGIGGEMKSDAQHAYDSAVWNYNDSFPQDEMALLNRETYLRSQGDRLGTLSTSRDIFTFKETLDFPKLGKSSNKRGGQEPRNKDFLDAVSPSGQPSSELIGTPTQSDNPVRPDLGPMNAAIDERVQPAIGEKVHTTWQGVENKVKARLTAETAKDPSKSYTEDDIATRVQRTQERYANKFVRINLAANNRAAVESFLSGSNLDPVFVDQARMAIQKYDARNAPRGGDSLPGINTTTHVYVERQWQNVGKAAREARRERSLKKGENPDDPKIVSRINRSVDRAQRRAVREYVTKSLDSNNRQALDKLLAEGKLDATLAAQIKDAMDAKKPKQANAQDTTQTQDTPDTVNADASTATEGKDNATDIDALLQEAEEIVEETENNTSEKKKYKFTKEEIAMAREFVKWGKGAEQQIGVVIDRAMELAPVEAELAVAQDAHTIWKLVNEYKTPKGLDAAITGLRTKQLSVSDDDTKRKIEENIHLLERARDVLVSDKPPTAEEIGKKLRDSSKKVNELSQQAKELRKPFQEALRAKVLASRQNTRFYSMLERLPVTLASSPDAGKQLLELYKLGKKKNTKALVLGILLLLSATTVSNVMDTGKTIMKDGMSAQ